MSGAPHDYVLVVDDDEDLRDAFEAALTASGHTVATAGDGSEALSWLRDKRPHPCMLVLDLMMPRMSGFELRAVMKSDAELSAIPVVVVTGAAALADARMAELDVEVLRKPIELRDLLKAVDRHCARPRLPGQWR